MMGRRRCCCGGCEIGEDDFNRADNADPGPLWSEEGAADWKIESNHLQCVTEGPLITTLRQPEPIRTDADYTVKFWFTLRTFPSSGTKTWKVICGYRDTSDYDYIELVYDASTGNLYPEFHATGITVNQTTHPATAPWSIYPGTAAFEMVVCYAPAEWTIAATGEDANQSDVYWETCGASQPDLPTSLGMVGFLAGDFDDFSYWIHWESDASCPYCECFCRHPDDVDDYLCLPEELTLTITPNTAYTCNSVDNVSMKMYQSDPDVSGASPVYDALAQKKTWYSEIFQPEAEEMWFVMECVDGRYRINCISYPDKGVTDAQATTLFFCDAGGNNDNGKWQTDALSTCDPLELVFQDLCPDITTCDLDGGGTGTRPRPCINGDCWDTGEEIDVRWTVTVTA